MKPQLSQMKSWFPELDQRLVEHHWERLDEQYFKRFDITAIGNHLQALAKVKPDNPVETVVEVLTDRELDCTILAFDYPGEFSLLAGMLTGMGFNIHSGGIYTYARKSEHTPARNRLRHLPASQLPRVDHLNRRKIVDHFRGTLETSEALEIWIPSFKQSLSRLVHLLEQPGETGRNQARHMVDEWVARRFERTRASHIPILYPVEIQIENEHSNFTRLKVVSQDTPGFLYAMSNALALNGISIEHLRINTVGGKIEDLIDFVDAAGEKIIDAHRLDQVKFSVLITKQFSYFLDQAPDPYAALSRFEQMLGDLLRLPEHGKWVELLGEPKVLRELAQLLGTSDFLWEDMIRQQYETLLPLMAPQVEGRRFADSLETLPERLEAALQGAADLAQQCALLNEFKDREIFLIDLDHILTPGADFRQLAEYLTYLAIIIVRQAVRINYEVLARRYGKPRTVAGFETRLAILGLGKLGGAALGYASDIELLFVYSDQGFTDGPESIPNAEFFEILVKDATRFIRAKREGIFNVDLRLRPYGIDGPLACSLETFCNYYGPTGPAHSLEKLSLVRLRAIGGDAELGSQIERLRDELIYSTASIQLKDLRELRVKQFEKKTQGGKLNAKFSPGALVDLEYDVQILQVMYGKDFPKLRTPRIHQALLALQEAGVLQENECQPLIQAYSFLRQLINGLRMLRGSAQDLFLPVAGSDEYQHLARRMGYTPQPGLDPGQQLHLEFETRTAAVRTFAERHFGRDSLPGEETGNIADIVLSGKLSLELRRKILGRSGFTNTERADLNLGYLVAAARTPELFARLAVLAVDILKRKPDPDMALNNWERFVRVLPEPEQHFADMLAQPMRLDILMSIFASSQFLADSLIRDPEFIEWATDSERLHSVCSRQMYGQLLFKLSADLDSGTAWLNGLRRFRRREFLRLGTKDMCLHASLAEITLELSNLADALVGAGLASVWHQLAAAGKVAKPMQGSWQDHFCILAFGKLGGGELNYSSDIDLIGVCDDAAASWLQTSDGATRQDPFGLALEGLHAVLNQYTDQGYVYRVDYRMRPYGREGQLVLPCSKFIEYYQTQAVLPELQALLKLRPIAGNMELGKQLMQSVRELLLKGYEHQAVAQAIEHTRDLGVRQSGLKLETALDVKSGIGGIRDIEFLVQGLQLIHGHDQPDLLGGNTLLVLKQLSQYGFLAPALAEQLAADYSYLRRLEHYLQILEDRQIHTLPTEQSELLALAKRMQGPDADADRFLDDLNSRLARVRQAYQNFLLENNGK